MAEKGLLIVCEDGRRFSDEVKAFTISSNFSRGPDEFSVTLASADREKLRYLELTPCELILDGQPQLIGRIEESWRGNTASSIKIAGRDFRGDLATCHVDPTFRVTSNESLVDVVKRVAGPAGITSVKADGDFGRRSALSGKASGLPSYVGFTEIKVQDLKPNAEETVWDFLRRLCARFGATVQAGEKRGELILAKPNFDQDPSYELRRSESAGTTNNIISAVAHRNYRDIPTFCLIAGKQWDPKKGKENRVTWSSGPVFTGRGGTIVKRVKPGEARPGEASDLYRLFFRRSAEARTQAEVDLVFNRAIAERFHNALHYNVELEGFRARDSGAIWTIDTLVDIRDEIADVTDTLWVHSRQISYAEGAGSAASLECWIPETFNLTEPGINPAPDGAKAQGGRGAPKPTGTIGAGYGRFDTPANTVATIAFGPAGPGLVSAFSPLAKVFSPSAILDSAEQLNAKTNKAE